MTDDSLLLETFTQKHTTGEVVFCAGLATTLYFREGHTEKARHAVRDCFDEYQKMCGAALRWWAISGRKPSLVAQLRSIDMTPYLLSPKWNTEAALDEGWSFLWHGGEKFDDASVFQFEAQGSSRREAEVEDDLSYLKASFPAPWFEGKKLTMLELVRRWSERLDVFHGYGGLALLESPNDGLVQMYGDKLSHIAMRYPGIEIDDPIVHALASRAGIKGGNWITVLSNHFIAKLGGVSALSSRLGAHFIVREYRGGAVVQSGPAPEIGDRNMGQDTPLYRRLAAVLKPVRIREHPPVAIKGALAEDESFDRWLGRFDS